MRSRISVAGSRSRSVIRVNMNAEPQIAASASSMNVCRRLMVLATHGTARSFRGGSRQRARVHWPSELGCRTATPPGARPHGRGARANRRAARARAERLRAGGLLAPVVRALRLQAFGAPPEAAPLLG